MDTPMRILVFLQGTVIMHASGEGQPREVRVRQSASREASVSDFANYVPIGRAAEKLLGWADKGAELLYLSAQRDSLGLVADKVAITRAGFPAGEVVCRAVDETYADVVVRLLPDVLIEDDAESIGGSREMASPFLPSEIRGKVRSIIVREFEGIDRLPDDPARLLTFSV